MKSASVKVVLAALRDHKVRYLIAGGLAVNAHGFLRFTKDADLVIELASENIHATFTALAALGYQAHHPDHRRAVCQLEESCALDSREGDEGAPVLERSASSNAD